MKKPVFTGVCTALVTPFCDGQIHIPTLRLLLDRQMAAQIPAVVIAGTTGESPTLSDAEKLRLFAAAKQHTGRRMKIIAGTGSNDTAHAVSLSRAAQDAGADALLVVSPYYNKATPTGIIAHYKAIAQAVDIPVIVYNVPSRTGLDIPVSVYQVLSEIENIAGVKEASPDIQKTLSIRAACGADFPIWSGNDDMTVPILSLGGQGVISVLSNVIPERMHQMTSAALSGDFKTAAAVQTQLLPLSRILFSEVNPIPVKAAMKQLGFDCGECRLPLTALSPEKQHQLSDRLRELADGFPQK